MEDAVQHATVTDSDNLTKRKSMGRKAERLKKQRVMSHQTGEDCKCVRFKCFQVTSEADRDSLVGRFNQLPNKDEQDAFISRLVTVKPIAQRRKRVEHAVHPQNEHSYRYHVPVVREGSSTDIQVCFRGFVAMLGITRGRMETIKKSLVTTGFSPKDGRGKHKNRPHRLSPKVKQLIHEHISSFRGPLSHHVTDPTRKLYLPELNVSKLFALFKEQHPDVNISCETYRILFHTNAVKVETEVEMKAAENWPGADSEHLSADRPAVKPQVKNEIDVTDDPWDPAEHQLHETGELDQLQTNSTNGSALEVEPVSEEDYDLNVAFEDSCESKLGSGEEFEPTEEHFGDDSDGENGDGAGVLDLTTTDNDTDMSEGERAPSPSYVMYDGEECVPSEENSSDDSDSESDDGAGLFYTASDNGTDMSKGERSPSPSYVTYDDGSDENCASDWSHLLSNFPMTAPFTGAPGFKLPDDFETTPTPLDFYQLFVTHDLIESFKVETNRYAVAVCTQKKARGNVSPKSVYATWKPVTTEEMTKFLAVLIHMGLVKKPGLEDYWSTHPALSTAFASRILKRTRFKAILKFFHLNDNAGYIPQGHPGHDPLFKIRPFLDHLIQRSQTLNSPDENLCIGEAVCPWRERSAFRCYKEDTQTGRGITLRLLCESASGYVCNLEVTCHQPGVSNTPVDVCARLLEPFANNGHTLFVDSGYCNPALAETLSAENTAVVGTVRANHVGLPKELARRKMGQGEMRYRRKNQLLYVRWKDTRDVHMLTTKHLPEMSSVRPQTEEKSKPVCVVDYLSNMAGVDKWDQLLSYLPLLQHKTDKWWKRLAFHLMTLAMIQAQILCNKYRAQRNQTALALEDFVKSVCVSLGDVSGTEAGGATTGAADAAAPPDAIHRLCYAGHFLQSIPPKPGSTRLRLLTCKVCYAQMKHQGASRQELKNSAPKSSYQCERCKVVLCLQPCFKVFHTVDRYDTVGTSRCQQVAVKT